MKEIYCLMNKYTYSLQSIEKCGGRGVPGRGGMSVYYGIPPESCKKSCDRHLTRSLSESVSYTKPHFAPFDSPVKDVQYYDVTIKYK